ncbi:hypothetical protein [Methylosinus sp. Sm6]|uniref:hypothetical protein n=1 Tax=Methylosinus sp. Sm6 TaxID=2866948 RepID=UPI001C99FA06|nr:hypothetical protein [Methylosinus sp. Sm6]MBY6242154.1 hypothetical protein [Methylosinus sp. Sm6]
MDESRRAAAAANDARDPAAGLDDAESTTEAAAPVAGDALGFGADVTVSAAGAAGAAARSEAARGAIAGSAAGLAIVFDLSAETPDAAGADKASFRAETCVSPFGKGAASTKGERSGADCALGLGVEAAVSPAALPTRGGAGLCAIWRISSVDEDGASCASAPVTLGPAETARGSRPAASDECARPAPPDGGAATGGPSFGSAPRVASARREAGAG